MWSRPAVFPKLLQAKQAADLHTPGFNQRMVAEVIKDGFLDRHVPTIRALQGSAMPCWPRWSARWPDWACTGTARGRHVPVAAPARGPGRRLLPRPWSATWPSCPAPPYADQADPRTLRLSFVTASAAQIDTGIAALAATIRAARLA
jgi:2-aminoadipate transaminase